MKQGVLNINEHDNELTKTAYKEVELLIKDEMAELKEWLASTFMSKFECGTHSQKYIDRYEKRHRIQDRFVIGAFIIACVALGERAIELVKYFIGG